MGPSVMGRFVGMTGVRSHMGVMEAVEARSGAMLEVISFVWNKGLTAAAGIIEEIIVAPIAVIHWTVVTVVITIVVRGAICACARCQCEKRGCAQSQVQFVFHGELPRPII